MMQQDARQDNKNNIGISVLSVQIVKNTCETDFKKGIYTSRRKKIICPELSGRKTLIYFVFFVSDLDAIVCHGPDC